MRKRAWILCILPFFPGCSFAPYVPVEMDTMSQSQRIKNEKALQSTIRFDVGTLEITGGKGMDSLYTLDLEYDKSGFRPEVQYDTDSSGEEGRFSFRLEGMHKPGLRKDGVGNTLRLKFNDSIPMGLEVSSGVGNARLSLSGMKLTRVTFESGVGGAKISVFEPNAVACDYISLKNGVGSIEAVGLGNLNFRELEFEGGVGGADLDFAGDWKQDATVRIQVGVGGVHLRMPRSVGVRVKAEKNFLSGIHLDGFTQNGSDYKSENYDGASVKVFMDVSTGIGGFKITWI
ncbi:MAG: hypothetical protein JXR49_19325 [Acidobacteria bacterium]|nr:hypothetical protein [Acidobacteriota bacterium]